MAIVRWTFTACLQRLQRKCPPDLRVALTARRNALPIDQPMHELALVPVCTSALASVLSSSMRFSLTFTGPKIPGRVNQAIDPAFS